MSETDTPFEMNVSGVFWRLPLVRLGCVLIVLYMSSIFVFINRVPFDQYNKVIVGVFFVLLAEVIAVAGLLWRINRKRRRRAIDRTKAGVYLWEGSQLVRLTTNFGEPLNEEELVSTCDQADGKMRAGSWGDVITNLFIIGIMFGPFMIGSVRWQVHAGTIVLWIAVIVRWIYLGDAIIPGFNRVRIDPVGWQWGGWSRRFKKSGRWEDTRVVIKPMTKMGRDRYFVVMGTESGTVGMIVPKASVELIKRACAGAIS